jgi:NTE family protein
MLRHGGVAVVLGALLSGGGGLRAQAAAASPERIGLVLSGGGARGCAHVGVLKVLEQLRIPIHCVAGTSMGSIVGGFYAYGLSPERLELEMTRAGNRRPWSLLLQDQAARQARSFRRKQEDFQFLVDIGLGWRDGGFRMPKGLKQGQNLELELLTLAAGAHDLASFDDLPIPFRAVAVELATGKPVVLDAGNLALAMRASMSLPGIFAPAMLDGRELLDGGLVDNVPIDLARAMGATRVIVVDIGTPVQIDKVESAVGVSAQMVQILGQQNVDQSLAKLTADDVLIRPELGDITSADFERAADAIRSGELAASAMADRLRPFSVDETRYAAFLTRQRRPEVSVTIHTIRIDNRSGLGDDVIRSRLRAEPGRVLDVDALRQDLEVIHGLGDFERVTYELLAAADGQHDLVVHASGKSWGPTYLKFGLALSSNLDGRSAFTVGTQANVRDLNELGAEWRTNLSLGDTTSLDSEFYQPLESSSTLFVAPRVSAQVAENSAAGATVGVKLYGAGIDLGLNLGTCSQVRVGVTRLRGEVDLAVALPIPGFAFDDGAVEAQWIVDTLDEGDFPTSGVRMACRWVGGYDALGSDAEYQSLSVGAAGYVSLGRTTAGVGVIYETSLAESVPLWRRSTLGGFTRLSGLADDSLGGEHSGFVALLLRHRLAGRRDDVFGFPVYIGGTLEAGNTWEQRDQVWHHLRLAGSAFLSVDTPIGPTYLAYGQAEGGERTFYLFVGQPF